MGDFESSIHGPAGEATRLPARRSFVVQFTGTSSADCRTFTGRIEHVLSGEAAGFAGGDELLAALESALAAAIEDESAQDASTEAGAKARP